MIGPVPVSLRVNGDPRTVGTIAGWTLADLLREGLGLIGTKIGCDDGTCGTCTVIVDGKPVRACRKEAVEFAGRDVRTIEGLGSGGDLHPLQVAFLEADAVQCGFCTPGLIMSAAALLEREPHPSRAAITRALGSNLCRCTGYQGILDAVEWAAGDRTGPARRWPFEVRPGEWRRGAEEKVIGTAAYAADLRADGMLHGMVLRSPHSHAEIEGIDISRARALAGVEAVLTAAEIPGENSYGRMLKDQPVLAGSRVRQIGDPVAAVAAISPEIARAALALIDVRYRPLPAVFDPIDALRDDAPRLHPDGNLLAENVLRRGDVEEGFAQADVIVDERYTTPWNEHAYLEPEAALAELQGDTIVVRTPTQSAYYFRGEVARVLGWPVDRVRIVATIVGGGFGGKSDISCQPLAAVLAVTTGRPVRIVYSRTESFISTTKRHPYRMHCRTGVTRDGRLTALQMDMLADTGAYASSGPGRMIKAFASAAGPYNWPNVDFHGRVVRTNNTTAGSMRGPGTTQPVFALESQMDLMAERLGMDPLELRRRNGLRRNDVLLSGQVLDHEPAAIATIDAVRPYYEEALERARASQARTGILRRGVGAASVWYGIGGGGFGSSAGYGSARVPGRATLEIGTDGGILLRTSAIDIGQGSDTALIAIAAGELGVSPASVRIETGDTSTTPDAGATSGSRVTFYVGNAVKAAAIELSRAALETASDLLEVATGDLDMADGAVRPLGVPDRIVTFAEIAQRRQEAGLPNDFLGVFDPPTASYDLDSGLGEPYPAYVSATQVAEVEVDITTGQVQVLRVVAAHDAGELLFPQGAVGQIEGGIVMGLGFALTESYVPGKTLGFKQYVIPRTRDAPEVICLMLREEGAPATDASKGLAESSSMAIAPAIVNAIANATGERHFSLPVEVKAVGRRDPTHPAAAAAPASSPLVVPQA